MPYRIVTLVYCVGHGPGGPEGNEVLLLERVKPPYPGLWVAPGGKVERGESPAEGATRELREETGLVADRVSLRAVVTETSPVDDWQWLIFVYRALDLSGTLVSDEREGRLAWFTPEALVDAKLPPADRFFMQDAMRGTSGVTEYRFDYDETHALIGSDPAWVSRRNQGPGCEPHR